MTKETMTENLPDTREGLEALAAQRGLELPSGWTKLSLDRKKAWVNKALLTATKPLPEVKPEPAKKGLLASAAAALNAIGTRLKGDKTPGRDHTPGEVFYNPDWKRSGSGGGRGWYPVQKIAPLPEPMTRQVARQLLRRNDKQPLGVRQEEWHRVNGFGKIGTGKRKAA